MDISKVYNANVYLDGTNSLLGKAKEHTLPEVVTVTEDQDALGMFGKLQLPTGIDVLTGKIKWGGFYPEVLDAANPYVARKIQTRGNVQTFGPGGLLTEEPLVATVNAAFKKLPLGVFGPKTSPELEVEYTCTYVRVELSGKELLEIDVHNHVWRVRGKDLLAAYRANLGI